MISMTLLPFLHLKHSVEHIWMIVKGGESGRE